MMRIFLLEWTRLSRSPRLLLILGGVLVGLLATSWWAASNSSRHDGVVHEAADRAREDWVSRGDAHPHQMAHFGDFVFRPIGPLAHLDSGVQATMGRVLRVEGHKRGTPLSSAASEAGPLARFGRFDPAFLLQRVVPLVMLLAGVGLNTMDRRRSQSFWMLAHGARGRDLVLGQTAYLASIGVLMLTVVTATSLLVSSAPMSPDSWARLGGFAGVYLIFLLVVAAAITVASSVARSSTSALFALLGFWVIGTTLLPRVTASVASTVAPLPTRDAFDTAMREAREKGIDGHNPQDARIKKLEQEVFAEYGVESRAELPINFDGVVMQMDEEYGNAVWDEHFGRLENTLDRQSNIARVAAVFNPFQAVRSVSMTLSGTDLAHDLAFQSDVELYRRGLVKALNDEHAYGGSKTGERNFKADAEFFAGLAAYSYEAAPIQSLIRSRLVEVVALVAWFALLAVSLLATGRRLERRGEV